ncbi:MAG: outer membrane protein [Hyphomicrobiales bacterium]
MNPYRFAAVATGSTVALALVLVAVITGARAVDLLLMQPEEVTIPQLDWTGAYVGGHFGAFDSVVDYTVGGVPGNFNLDLDDVVGGFAVGYNMQHKRIVYGIDGDVGFTKPSDTIRLGGPFDRHRIDLNAHIRARLGYNLDQFLFFVAGGVAFADYDLRMSDGAGTSLDRGELMVGFSVGAGIEYAIAENILFRGEYIYDNYGKQTISGGTVGAVTFTDREIDLDTHTVRSSLIWRFPVEGLLPRN